MIDNTATFDSPAVQRAKQQFNLDVTYTVEIIYPETAKAYLDKIGKQRKWRQADSARIARGHRGRRLHARA